MMIKKTLEILLLLSLTAVATADESAQSSHLGVSDVLLEDMPIEWADSYVVNPEVQAFIGQMVTNYHYDRHTLELAFSRIKVRPKVIEKSNNQPEVITPFYQYRRRFVSPSRIKQGREFAKRHAAWLHKAEQEFGVEPRVIVALIGV